MRMKEKHECESDNYNIDDYIFDFLSNEEDVDDYFEGE